jgi:hypothetical protein
MTIRLPHPAPTGASLLTALALATTGLAQDASWNLPPRGFAEFERETQVWRIAPGQDQKRGGLLRPIDATSAWTIRTWPRAPIADGFQVVDFDDSGWKSTRLPLRTQGGDARGELIWPESERVLDARVAFEVPPRTKAAVLAIEHEDPIQVWLNGVRILEQPADGQRRHSELVFADDVLALFERRRNVLSIQVRNETGGSFVAVELSVSPRAFASADNARARVERDRQEAARLQGSLYTIWRAPPVLCAGELDPSRQFMPRGPVDLRDLGAFVAFDLRRATRRGKVSAMIPLSWRFGDLQLSGNAEPADAEGRQRIVLRVQGVEPAAKRYESRFYEREVRRWFEYGFDGELVVERRWDAARGVVESFDGRLTGTLTAVGGEEAGRTFELEHAESWRLKAVREPRDARFRTEVVEAIQKGRQFLRRSVEDPNNPQMQAGGEDRTYPSGKLALVLLAMIHADIPQDDEVLVRGLDELRRRKLVDTYSVANAIMAIEAYYRPRGEYEELLSGAIRKPRERRLSDADRALVREWTDILLANMDTRVDRAYLARWSYVGEPRYDHSVNQYGLLGLYSAMLCGIQVSPQIWSAAAAHLADSQQRPDHRIALELVSHRQLQTLEEGGATSTGSRPTGVGGWGYVEAVANGEPRPVYGSMTCAGLTGLTIALAGMEQAGLSRDRNLAAANEALRQGFAWLAENFTARWHPGPGLHASYYSHVFYYLYGLERACELSGIALINGRDWYLEGSLALLPRQNGDGSWHGTTGGEYDAATITAMAVLFLKKSSMPVFTQR